MKAVVFYSWQSDLPNKTNRGLIEEALEAAVEGLKQDDEVLVEAAIDRDTFRGARVSRTSVSLSFRRSILPRRWCVTCPW